MTDIAVLSKQDIGVAENDPIWQAIDAGGGQTVDVRGVLRVLAERGYQIVKITRRQSPPFQE